MGLSAPGWLGLATAAWLGLAWLGLSQELLLARLPSVVWSQPMPQRAQGSSSCGPNSSKRNAAQNPGTGSGQMSALPALAEPNQGQHLLQVLPRQQRGRWRASCAWGSQAALQPLLMAQAGGDVLRCF